MAFLHRRGTGTGKGLQLGGRIVVGSGHGCHLTIVDPALAGRHFEIVRVRDGHYRLHHLAEAGQTLVNGEPASQTVLEDGDIIAVGGVAFTFTQDADEVVQDQDIDFDDLSARISLRQDAARPVYERREAGDEVVRLQAAYALTRAIGLETDAEAALERVLDTALDVFKPDRGAIFLLEPGTDRIASQRARTRSGGDERVRVSRSVLRKALEHREAIVSIDAAADARFSTAHSVRIADVHSIMCAPMIFRDECIGLIYLDSMMSTGLFSDKDLELLTTFGQQAAMAVKNAYLLNDLQQANRELRGAKEAAESANEALRHKNEELEKLVVRDPLTGLYNHAYLQEQVAQELRRAQRHGQPFGLILLNIDHFRGINDAHGHTKGNRLLCLLAELLRGAGRGADIGARIEERSTVTRYDGDTFAVLLPETSKRGASVAAERLRQSVEGFAFATEELPAVTISLGVAGFPEDSTQRAGLITAAETALFAAKQVGGNQTIAYSSSLNSLSEQRSTSELGRIMALDRTIRERLVRYLYQPIVSAAPGHAIFAYEALCRPADATFSGPVDLLDTAERKGRIQELGAVMRIEAVQPLAQLPAPRLLFMNLHPLELGEELIDWAQRCTARDRIVLEVTESAEIKEHDRVRDLLMRLKQLGFRIALDDLGSGYSGLNSLALLEPDFVKLDMRMVRNIGSDSRSSRLIKHILDYSKGEGMRVVAEGIETPRERDVVSELGVDLLQGYLFARPAPPFCEIRDTDAE